MHLECNLERRTKDMEILDNTLRDLKQKYEKLHNEYQNQCETLHLALKANEDYIQYSEFDNKHNIATKTVMKLSMSFINSHPKAFV